MASSRWRSVLGIALLARNLVPNSALIVTVNASSPQEMTDRRAELVWRVGEDRVPVGVTDESLGKWDLAATQHRIITDIVLRAMRERLDGAIWRQFLNIDYADGAYMQTLGGVILGAEDHERWVACRFDEVAYARFGEDALLVRVPLLTAKERRRLEEQLPDEGGLELDLSGVDRADKVDYVSVYRYAHLLTMPA